MIVNVVIVVYDNVVIDDDVEFTITSSWRRAEKKNVAAVA